MTDKPLRAVALASKAWPFEEARKLLARVERSDPAKREVLFETGYGPSGLPHIGTFGEVARTTMVRHAFELMSDFPTRLLCFSDDMDGLRKVPDNIPNRDLVAKYLGRPLTQIPDPFDKYESFGHHNNAMLRRFLDRYGFEYEFASSTEYYTSGRFDGALREVLERYDEVMAIMLPSLREERSQTYSPFLPIHPESGIVMQVPIEERRIDAGTIVWRDPETGRIYETPVTGGHAKLQWKPDWAMRWHALGVDYEMSGKDLIDSVKLASGICRALGSEQRIGRGDGCLRHTTGGQQRLEGFQTGSRLPTLHIQIQSAEARCQLCERPDCGLYLGCSGLRPSGRRPQRRSENPGRVA